MNSKRFALKLARDFDHIFIDEQFENLYNRSSVTYQYLNYVEIH